MRFYGVTLLHFTTVLALLASLLSTAIAQDEVDVQIGLSQETVAITSNFDGTNVVIFGSIENAEPELLAQNRYDIVVVLSGPTEEVIVRRKERRMGIWINGKSVRFGDVPSSYSIATTKPLDQIADSGDAKILQIGIENLSVVADDEAAAGNDTEQFKTSLARLKVKNQLFLERIGGVKFLSPTLFKATLAVPANVPIGKHNARAFLFRDGKFMNSKFAEMQVRKIGFEQFTYNLAHEYSLLYGIIAVLIAMATGWLASVIFSKD